MLIHLNKKDKSLLILPALIRQFPKESEYLRNISGGANYVDYQNAFNKVKRSNSLIIPSSGLADQTSVGLKEAAVTPVALGLNKQTKRDTGDIMMKVNNYSFINCSCGLKIKIPPDLQEVRTFLPAVRKKTFNPQLSHNTTPIVYFLIDNLIPLTN